MKRIHVLIVGAVTLAVVGQTVGGAAHASAKPASGGFKTSTSAILKPEALPALKIDSRAAPERFDYQVVGSPTALLINDDGAVEAVDQDGHTLATLPAPSALDANGDMVPTHYELSGTTLTQVVEHRSGRYAYGIVVERNPWFWIKCGAALALFVVGLTPAKILKAGSIIKSAVKFVAYLKKYKTAKAAAAKLAALLGSASGVDDVVQNCYP